MWRDQSVVQLTARGVVAASPLAQENTTDRSNLATTKWPLARIVETHKGADGLVRVVTLKTSEGSNIMRPIAKISPLPMVDVPEETGEYDSKRPRRSPRIAALNHNIPV